MEKVLARATGSSGVSVDIYDDDLAVRLLTRLKVPARSRPRKLDLLDVGAAAAKADGMTYGDITEDAYGVPALNAALAALDEEAGADHRAKQKTDRIRRFVEQFKGQQVTARTLAEFGVHAATARNYLNTMVRQKLARMVQPSKGTRPAVYEVAGNGAVEASQRGGRRKSREVSSNAKAYSNKSEEEKDAMLTAGLLAISNGLSVSSKTPGAMKVCRKIMKKLDVTEWQVVEALRASSEYFRVEGAGHSRSYGLTKAGATKLRYAIKRHKLSSFAKQIEKEAEKVLA